MLATTVGFERRSSVVQGVAKSVPALAGGRVDLFESLTEATDVRARTGRPAFASDHDRADAVVGVPPLPLMHKGSEHEPSQDGTEGAGELVASYFEEC